NIRTLIDGLHTRYSHAVVEQAAIAGALNADVLRDPDKAAEAAAYVARRLDLISEETERGWQGSVNPDYEGLGGYMFERIVRGVRDVSILDAALINSADARAIDRYTAKLQDVYAKPPVLRRNDKGEQVAGPISLLAAVLAAGRKGLTMQ